MKQPISWFYLVLLSAVTALAQPAMRTMSSPVNHPMINAWLPYINPDGNSLLFLSDNTEGKVPKLFFTSRTGADWKDPVELPRGLNSPVNFRDGFSLSPDGRTIYASSSRPGGVGGYDIVGFSAANPAEDGKNIGAPVNSKEHEASFVLTTDGNTAYFMRCATMNPGGAAGCRIMTATRKNNSSLWETPAELPPSINAGNSQFPRILADGTTLFFASDKHTPAKGGLDLYMTSRTDAGWSDPIPLDFLNTEGDDAMVSVQAAGRYATSAIRTNGKFQLTEVPFPAEVKPVTVMKLLGSITGHPKHDGFYVSLLSGTTGKPVATVRPDAEGNFSLYLTGGKRHLLVIDPSEDGGPCFIRNYDLRTGSVQARERLSAELPQLGAASAIDLTGIHFEEGRPDPVSMAMVSRIQRLMRNNPGMAFVLNAGPDLPADSSGPGELLDQTAEALIKFLKDRSLANPITISRTDSAAGSLVLRVGGN
ncbi:MAG: hypothetical protein ACKORJ_10045 [Bacteroidota bacterium]